jgi:hypothetical protein
VEGDTNMAMKACETSGRKRLLVRPLSRTTCDGCKAGLRDAAHKAYREIEAAGGTPDEAYAAQVKAEERWTEDRKAGRI